MTFAFSFLPRAIPENEETFCSLTDPDPDRHDPESLTDLENVRRLSARILNVIVLALLAMSTILNWQEGSSTVIPSLCLAAFVPPAAALWLHLDKRSSIGPLFLLTGSLALLGAYLLLSGRTPDCSSLYWYLIYPPMVMFCLGLRYGTMMFAAFYLFLLVMLLTPLNALLAVPLTPPETHRFLLAMLGGFIFSWCAECTIHNTRLALNMTMKRLEKEAVTDLLTGLGNRRHFQSFFAWVLSNAARNNNSFAVALIDIDRFKEVNDKFGHEVGDGLLRHMTAEITAVKRSSDRLFRWGGEEFILLMPPQSTILDARQAAERIRRHVEQTPYHTGCLHIPYTISIGLYAGTVKAGEEDQAGPLLEADRNLYAAKARGRNQVIG